MLTLDGSTYAVHGEFSTGEQATSKLLPGFAVDVTSVLAAKSEPVRIVCLRFSGAGVR